MAAPPLIHGTLIATVQYNANGGSNAPSQSRKEEVYVGEGYHAVYVPVTSSVPTRDGYSLTKCLIEKGHFVYAVDIADNKFIGIDNVKYLKCDLKNPREIEKIKDIIESDNVRIKAIYNLCGIFKMESVIEGSSEDLESIIRINFLSMYYVNKYLFNFLDKGSTIINMSSEVARYSCLPFQSYYTMTKKMVECYSDDLRRELNYL